MLIRCILSPASQKEKPGSTVNDVGFVLWTFVASGKRKEETVVIVEGLERAQRSPRWKQGRQWMDQGSELALHAYLLTYFPSNPLNEGAGCFASCSQLSPSSQNRNRSPAQRN